MKRLWVAGAAAVVLVAAGIWFFGRARAATLPSVRFGTVERGNIASTVSATGTLGAVQTVEVGTQVSGQVSALLVDFNDKVKQGQLIARIDPTLLQQAVEDAQASLERADAQLHQSQAEYERSRELYASKTITATEFGTAESNWLQARASVKSAQVALERARRNLGYTNIYAPIDGVVVERDVDVGQTVAANFSAPQLFVIANDLSRMQILASVDESDIGQIKEGQTATFTVQAYNNRTFQGTVQQVRLQSKTSDNVVNYTVVVALSNPDGALMPGMTATVKFRTASADDVLVVPNAALRVRPAEALIEKATTSGGPPAGATMPAGAGAPGAGAGLPERFAASGTTATATAAQGLIWVEGTNGKLKSIPVTTGITDGQHTQVSGPGLGEGTRVAIAINASGTAEESPATTSTGTNPLQQQRRSGPPGPPPGGF